MNWKKFIPLIPAALVLGSLMFPWGCANTTTPPSGGPKDTIPPVLVGVKPLPGTVNVNPNKTKLLFTFDEYVKIKDANNIFLSPPLPKKPKAVIKGKSVEVTFESDLDTNTTYTLDLTGAIVDNNEGNPFPGFTLVFSTGSQIDSLCVTGLVQDCSTLKPLKGATVLLYKDQADSAIFLHLPDAATKTDDWGYFSIRNIKDTIYRVYALVDGNNNNMYDPDNDRVAFLDEPFRPTVVFNDSLYEFKKFDMKDTALCMARKTEMELNVFREMPSKQYIVNKERTGLRSGYVTFMAPDVVIHGMRIKGLPADKLLSQINPQRDCLELWINDQRNLPDTLQLLLRYDKTDTLGVMQPTDETVKLVLDRKMRQEIQKQAYSLDRKHEDTIAVMKATVDPGTVEQYGFEITFNYPLIESAWDSLVFRAVNPRQQESFGQVTVTQDPNNLRKFSVMPLESFQQGYEYFLKVPHRKFRDINGFWNDSTEMKVSLPNDDKLSSITLELSGVKHQYIVDLLNEKRDKVLRSYNVDKDITLLFPYLKAGAYCIRLTEDLNGNKLVDTGSLLEHRQPEKARFFKLEDQVLIKVLERSEMVWTLDMEELFR